MGEEMARKSTGSSGRKSPGKRAGRKRSSSGASEEIRQEMHDRKRGSGKSRKQAIAIGLSRARRAGKDVPAPKAGKTSAATRKKAQADSRAGTKKRAARKTASKRTARKSAGRKTAASRKRG
jgi:hypothetical protein